MHYVYLITCLLNNKQYVGETKNPKSRMKGHFFPSESRNNRLQVIQRAIKKHGSQNFTFEIVSEHPTVEEAFEAEKKLILEKKENGIELYNMNEGGRGGENPSLSVRKKISESHKGKRLSEEIKEKIRKTVSKQVNDPVRREKQKEIAKSWWESLTQEEKDIRVKKLRKGRKYLPLTEEKKKQISETLKKNADLKGRAKDNIVDLIHNCPDCGKEVKRKGIANWKSQIKSGRCKSCRNKAGHVARRLAKINQAAPCDSLQLTEKQSENEHRDLVCENPFDNFSQSPFQN